MILCRRSMSDRRAMEKARRFTRDNIALSILAPPTPPPQLNAQMRPLRRELQFLRRDKVFVDVQLRMPPTVQRSPIAQAPESPSKIERPLILPKPGLTFRRFSAKRRPWPHLITTPTKG